MKYGLLFFSLLVVNIADAYDCSNHKPFVPVGYQAVDLYVGHFMWKDTGAGKEEIVEEVCSSKESLQIPVLDIRGREEEWFYCDKEPRPQMECTTTFQGLPTVIQVKPFIVIRRWNGAAGRDSHFHAYVIPNQDPTRYFDLFARHVSSSLTTQSFVLDASGGGRGENSGIDSYYVRVDFK